MVDFPSKQGSLTTDGSHEVAYFGCNTRSLVESHKKKSDIYEAG